MSFSLVILRGDIITCYSHEPANGLDSAGIVDEVLEQPHLLQEIKTGEFERLCQKRLTVKIADLGKTKSLLENKRYTASLTADSNLELTGEGAITAPENIAPLLINTGQPPSMLKVEEENLESYFLRTIEYEGETWAS